MKRRRIAMLAVTQLLLGLGLGLVAAPAGAASTWTITKAVSGLGTPSAGSTVTLTATCPAGTTPINGGYGTQGQDIRRMFEYTNFASGGTYQVKLDNETGASASVRAFVNCVSTGYFTNEITKTQGFYIGADSLATGPMSCDPGWFALSANVYFSSSDGTLLTSTPDLEFDGWLAKGWSSVVSSVMYVSLHCVPQSDIPGAQVHQTSQSVVWGTGVSADCPSGLVPIAGGSYMSGGDFGALAVDSQTTATGWAGTALALDGGTMATNVVCIAAQRPVVAIDDIAAYPETNSTSAIANFEGYDPAYAGGYTLGLRCTLQAQTGTPTSANFSQQPCTSPLQLNNLPEGDYWFYVHAVTSDGRTSFPDASAALSIDATAPTVTFDEAVQTLFGTNAPTVHGTIDDLHMVRRQVTCGVDDGAPVACGQTYPVDSGSDNIPPYQDFRGAQTFTLSNVPSGNHVLHVTVTDDLGNVTPAEFPFVVDASGPVITETAPTRPVTVATSTTARWTGTDATGIASYAVQWQRASYNAGFGSWSAPVSTGTATSRSFSSLSRGYTYCYHAQGTDTFGYVGGWSGRKCTAIPLDDRDFVRSSGWTASSPKGWFRGTALTASKLGAALTVTGAQVKRIAIEAKKCSTCGTVGVYVGSKLIAKVVLHATKTSRALISLKTFSLRTGAVKLKVLTSGKPVQIDAVAISRL